MEGEAIKGGERVAGDSTPLKRGKIHEMESEQARQHISNENQSSYHIIPYCHIIT
jgi:hypothetical protein